MKILEKIIKKQADLHRAEPITIAFFGDSVTQGCFECYKTGETSFDTKFDPHFAYPNRVKEILALLYPSVSVNVINGGISGDAAKLAKGRLERDILRYRPDLTVVSFGLNDCVADEGVEKYGKDLAEIFSRILASGSEVIFLTENYMNTTVSPHITDAFYRAYAEKNAQVQLGGQLKRYLDEAKEVCAAYQIPVCDMYSVWDCWAKNQVEVTELLSNKLNHPVREIHYYMAIKLIEQMFFA